MNVLTLDVETTISNKGQPFDVNNKCVVVGVKYPTWDAVHYYEERFNNLQLVINKAPIICGFNIKFDLHWLRKIGINIRNITVWDCQLAHFILNCQEVRLPSLNKVAAFYGLGQKLDIIKEEYWDKGIDTDQIPRNILSEYLTQDLVLTEQVYEKQYEQFRNDPRFNLFKLQCADLLVLEEIEWSGVFFNTEEALKKAEEIKIELDEIYTDISNILGGVPFNPNSNDDVSCILYGGVIVDTIRVPIGFYKKGAAKEGEIKYKNIDKRYSLPRLVEPLDGTESKTVKEYDSEGFPMTSQTYWQVNDTVFRSLKLNKKAKEVVSLLTKYAEKSKLRGTYLVGYSKLIEKMNWEHNMLHPTINQCVVITGRTSSSKPNGQNADPITKVYMQSRYNDSSR
jgi:DNA polymerase I-like protein with 3'-5' exonuclease and polymerase domains